MSTDNNANTEDTIAAAAAAGEGINQSTSQAQARWDEMYKRLEQYQKEHGDCLVPNRYEEDPQLGAWVSTQRRHYKMIEAGEPSPLTEHRMEKLEKIGFKWSAKNPRHLQWESRFQSLLRFKEKYGHTQVPINWEEDVQLANWVSTQRQEYQNLLKGRNTRLDERRVRLLNGVGFAWQLQRGGRKRHLEARRPSASSGTTDAMGRPAAASPPDHPANLAKRSKTTAAAKEKGIQAEESKKEAINKETSLLGKRTRDEPQAPAPTGGIPVAGAARSMAGGVGSLLGVGPESLANPSTLGASLQTRGILDSMISRRTALPSSMLTSSAGRSYLERLAANVVGGSDMSSLWLQSQRQQGILASLCRPNADPFAHLAFHPRASASIASPFSLGSLQMPLQGSNSTASAAATDHLWRQAAAARDSAAVASFGGVPTGLEGTYSSSGLQQTQTSQLEAAMELSLLSARRAPAGTQEWHFR